MSGIKTWVRGMAKRSMGFRKLLRFAIYMIRGTMYRMKGLTVKVDERKVLFISFNGRAYSDTPKAVYEYMRSCGKYDGYKYVWVFKEPEKYRHLSERNDTEIVSLDIGDFSRALLSSKYWFSNFRVFDHVWPRKNQVYTQCWHGTPLKRLGFDITETDNAMNSIPEIRKKYVMDAKKTTWLLSPSAYATEKFISAWNLREYGKEDRIIEVGYPRNDRLARAANVGMSETELDEMKSRIGIAPDDKRKIVLYAPTWRDNQYDPKIGYVYDLRIDFDRLKEEFENDYIILFRVHYLVLKSFDFRHYEGFIYDCSDYDDINDLYLVSDLLLTDYSSVFFDYANLNKPMLFYMYDLDEYADKTRGFYFGVDELPGPIIREESGLAPAIREATTEERSESGLAAAATAESVAAVESGSVIVATTKPELAAAMTNPPPVLPDEKYRAFKAKYTCLDDGGATTRLVERVVQ